MLLRGLSRSLRTASENPSENAFDAALVPRCRPWVLPWSIPPPDIPLNYYCTRVARRTSYLPLRRPLPCSHRLRCRESWSPTIRLSTSRRFPGPLPNFVHAESQLVTVKVGPWDRNLLHPFTIVKAAAVSSLNSPAHPKNPARQSPKGLCASSTAPAPLATLHPVTTSAASAIPVLRTPSSPRSVAFRSSCHPLHLHPPPVPGGIVVILPDNPRHPSHLPPARSVRQWWALPPAVSGSCCWQMPPTTLAASRSSTAHRSGQDRPRHLVQSHANKARASGFRSAKRSAVFDVGRRWLKRVDFRTSLRQSTVVE